MVRTTIKIGRKAITIVVIAVIEVGLGVDVIVRVLVPPEIVGHFDAVGTSTIRWLFCIQKHHAKIVAIENPIAVTDWQLE